MKSERDLDKIISGVLFEFMGWLTTRDVVLCLSSNHECSFAVDAIVEFCEMKNISTDNADVSHWEDYKCPYRLKEMDKRDLENKFGSIV